MHDHTSRAYLPHHELESVIITIIIVVSVIIIIIIMIHEV